MLKISSKGGTGIAILFFSIFFLYSGNTLPIFAEIDERAIYDITDRPKFEQTPVVCIYEPDEPRARDVIVDAWMKKTQNGIKSWEHSLKTSGPFDGDGRWSIDIITIPKEKASSFDSSDCRVEVQFTSTPNEDRSHAAGWEIHDGTKSQIKLLYMQLEYCGERIDEDTLEIYPEFCPTDDFVRSGILGNVAAHEFGHSIGLGHYKSLNPQLNYEWSLDPVSSPSIMTVASHYNEELNQIRKVDIQRVKDIYGSLGFKDYHSVMNSSSDKQQPNSTSESTIKSTEDSLSDIFKNLGTTRTVEKSITEESVVPQWIRNNAKWWVDGTINDVTFISAIQHLIKENIITISSDLQETYSRNDNSVESSNSNATEKTNTQTIPPWIKDTTRFWVEQKLDDQAFLNALQFLINDKIIDMSTMAGYDKSIESDYGGNNDEDKDEIPYSSESSSDIASVDKQHKPSTTAAESKYQNKTNKYFIYHPIGWLSHEESASLVYFYPQDLTKDSFEYISISYTRNNESNGFYDLIGDMVKLDPKEKYDLKETMLSGWIKTLQNNDNFGTDIEIISSFVDLTSNSIMFHAQLSSVLVLHDGNNSTIPVKQQILFQMTNVDDAYLISAVASPDRFDKNIRMYDKSISSFRLD